MDQGIDALKEELLEKFRQGLNEITARPLGNLEQMEDAVGKLKTELGRQTLERLIILKKTPKTKV